MDSMLWRLRSQRIIIIIIIIITLREGGKRALMDLKTLDKEIDNTGTISQLPGTGHPRQTNVHFSCRSYLIILSSEVT